MKYPYTVVKDGTWYPAGTEVPEDIFVCAEEMACYSKTEINRMPVSELRTLAEKEGISGFDSKPGAELKKLLIQKYEL